MRIITGKARGSKLISPPTIETRPTLDRIKEAMFNILSNKIIIEDSIVLDLFAGTGSLGLEAASRGAIKCHLIDKGMETFPCLKQNVDKLHFGDICTIYNKDSYEMLEDFNKYNEKFNLIFIDPPYAKEMIPPAIETIDEYNLLIENGLIVTKIDTKETIYQGSSNIKLIESRKYGNTTVCFYK